MLAKNPHEEAVLLTRVALDILDEPDHPDVMEMARRAGFKQPRFLEGKLEEEIRRLWPPLTPGAMGNVSPYVLHVSTRKDEPLFCRRVLQPVPEWFIGSISRFGGVFMPLHLRQVDVDLTVVDGRKRLEGTHEHNRRTFLLWNDARKQKPGLGCRLHATMPAWHVPAGMTMDDCEAISREANFSRVVVGKIDEIFWTHRMQATGKTGPQIAEELRIGERTVDRYLTLRGLSDRALAELQAEQLPLVAAYTLAARTHEEQDAHLDAIEAEEVTGKKLARRHLELLMGPTKPKAPKFRDLIVAADGAGAADRDARLAAAVLKYAAGDQAALDDFPDLLATLR
jgi:hypothetical protein